MVDYTADQLSVTLPNWQAPMTKFSTEKALLAFLLASWIFHTDSFLWNVSTLREVCDDAPGRV
jgi:hypothetical protein